MKRLLTASALVVAFAAGGVAQRLTTGVSTRGIVLTANTIAEETEYWEVRTAAGESVVLMGRRDVPIVKWLRQAEGQIVVLRIDAVSTTSIAGESRSAERR